MRTLSELFRGMFETALQKFWWLFLYILVAENFLVLLWAYAVQGQPGPETQEYSILGVYSMAMLCSAAASFAGGLVGFLFGVPHGAGESAPRSDHSPATRVSTGEAPATRRSYTNLEQISDGLTKALLGIGLTQIHNFPGWMRETGAFVGGSFGPGRAGELVAISVLVYGFLAGLLFTYVTSRHYLKQAFKDTTST